jgi:hypothetical protein
MKNTADRGVRAGDNSLLLEKLLIIELFKLGVPQAEIGRKIKMDLAAVNAFLKGIRRNAEK